MSKFLTAKEVAETLSLSLGHVAALCRRGKLGKARKFGSSWAIPEDDVLVYRYLKRKKK